MMHDVDMERPGADEGGLVAAATAGDEQAFATLTRRHRRELQVHCYRMLASFEDAEDMVQETFLRAWQKRETYQGRASFRAWLYRIATNACLDFLERTAREVTDIPVRVVPPAQAATTPHIPWLQPYPDRLLEQPTGATPPDVALVRREAIELAWLIALQLLPPKQRAALILCEVLDFPASEAAELLDSSVAAINGALQRARAAIRRHAPGLDQSPHIDAAVSEQDRRVVERYASATERCDVAEIARLLREDVRFAMPPESLAYEGREAVLRSLDEGGFGTPPYDDFRCLITSANGLPAVANYIRKPGEDGYRAFTIDVLRVEDGAVTEITAFDLAPLVDAFGLPATLA